jgi:hypothetical protein
MKHALCAVCVLTSDATLMDNTLHLWLAALLVSKPTASTAACTKPGVHPICKSRRMKPAMYIAACAVLQLATVVSHSGRSKDDLGDHMDFAAAAPSAAFERSSVRKAAHCV